MAKTEDRLIDSPYLSDRIKLVIVWIAIVVLSMASWFGFIQMARFLFLLALGE